MVSRKEGHWESPHDTAVSLLAITGFMLVRKDAQASVDYRVDLNGAKKLSGHADAGNVTREDSVVIEMKDLLKDATNELRIQRSPADAAGRLYYTAHLRYFTPAEDVEAASFGIGVSHEYSLADDAAAAPVTQAKLGDVVRVKVTLVAPADLNFLVLEDYLPAGLEAIDASLKTTPPEIQRRMAEEQRKSYQVSKRYSPFGHTDLRDNRAVLFARLRRERRLRVHVLRACDDAGRIQGAARHLVRAVLPGGLGPRRRRRIRGDGRRARGVRRPAVRR